MALPTKEQLDNPKFRETYEKAIRDALVMAYPGRCSWCNADPQEAAARHEGPHATWCPHFREEQRWAIR